jgi:hypothetical protein
MWGVAVRVRAPQAKRRLLVLAVGALALSLTCGAVDYALLLYTGRPLLSVHTGTYADGGSREYTGFGYNVTFRVRLASPGAAIDGQPRTIQVLTPQGELRYWLVPHTFRRGVFRD